MLVEKIKEIIEGFNNSLPEEVELFHFNYGKDHWQNLGDYEDDCDNPFDERKKYLLLLWQDRTNKFNDYNAIVGHEFTGEMYLVVRSRYDEEDYNFKYETHIKNLYAESIKITNEFSDCDGWLVKKWKEIEVENAYDTNLDGLKIQFTLNYDEI